MSTFHDDAEDAAELVEKIRERPRAEARSRALSAGDVKHRLAGVKKNVVPVLPPDRESRTHLGAFTFSVFARPLLYNVSPVSGQPTKPVDAVFDACDQSYD